jgi:hypothetical protein
VDAGEAFRQDVQLLFGEGLDHQLADHADMAGCRTVHQLPGIGAQLLVEDPVEQCATCIEVTSR